MKTCLRTLLYPALITGVALGLSARVSAQTFTNLHNFTGADGAYPEAGLVLSGSYFYGTTSSGVASGNGTVFKINTNGTGLMLLHSFTATPPSAPFFNSDGANSQAGLVLSGDTLYGTARNGGSSGNGTVFKVNTDGNGFTNLYSFTLLFASTNSDGAHPYAGLVLSGDILYGTTYLGGKSGRGAIFAINTNGSGFTNLHSLTGSDGFNPAATLLLSGSNLYGTTAFGGSAGNGTVFAVNTNGTGFTNLHVFTSISGSNFTNTDGSTLYTGLILSGNVLYGTAYSGGIFGRGTVFALGTDGTGFTNLHNFANNEGAYPAGGLVVSGNTLYGTTYQGGSCSNGTLFALDTDGSAFTILHNLNSSSDGGFPLAGLVLSGNSLYGTAQGGSFGFGTVFSLFVLPRLAITRSGVNVILTWPTNAAGFALQSATNLASPVVWNTVAPEPVITDGANAVTNLISGPQNFYRLSQ